MYRTNIMAICMECEQVFGLGLDSEVVLRFGKSVHHVCREYEEKGNVSYGK